MPAEWEPHEATWISWPHPETQSFPGSYAQVIPHFVKMAAALAESEIVRINVRDAREESSLKKLLKGLPPERIEFHHIPTNEPWCRDHGPLFLRHRELPKLAAVKFGFNAWGWKLSPCDQDNEAGRLMAAAVGAPVFDRRDFILEGGAIDVNGAGCVLTTESCLLNVNRNPGHSRADIEQTLRDNLGIRKILWLGDGIAGDDTDGHIDDIARFVDEQTVLAAVEEDEEDPNYEPLRANFERLRSMALADGSPLRIHALPMPPRIVREGQRLPASYANFYIANTIVLLPVFGDATDAWAVSIIRELFPSRKVVPLDCREIIWGLGAFHCLTQQQPATR